MLARIKERARTMSKSRLAVAAAQDLDVLHAVIEAQTMGLVDPILVGEESKIRGLAQEQGWDLGGITVIDEGDLTKTAEVAVRLVADGKADFLMKGLIDTSILLKALLNREFGLRGEGILSHIMLYEPKLYHKAILLTDGGMNIEPSLEDKAGIVRNAVECAHRIGIETVKVACLAAKEKVNEKMPSTVDARKLQEMCEAGEFGPGVIVEGPLALDLAVSREAAETKGFASRIAGDADVLLVPTIEVGNGIGKALTYLAGAESAGVIMGAKVPVILVSRADSYEAKLNSIALGAVVAAK
ncbi:MAG: bifunctional enoyl-CoA hydratase/phosphate acetyltransferase [Bacillota bacterium]|nr:bifunctional enoyl-CoA hydratase/phosphate acetyltransferase [Bacillota bacterium]